MLESAVYQFFFLLPNCVAVDRLRNINSLCEVLFLHVSDINAVRLFRYAPAGLNPAEIVCVVANIVNETCELACASGMKFR